jgi:sigma-B regulation protein RsbU (phosphoserine phosphatase)
MLLAQNSSGDVHAPAEVVGHLNRRFQSKDDQYFTINYGFVDNRRKSLTLTQAGHPSPVLIQHGQDLQVLGDGGYPVGLWPDAEYETIQTSFCPGDRLVLYSDGIVECANQKGLLRTLLPDSRLIWRSM